MSSRREKSMPRALQKGEEVLINTCSTRSRNCFGPMELRHGASVGGGAGADIGASARNGVGVGVGAATDYYTKKWPNVGASSSIDVSTSADAGAGAKDAIGKGAGTNAISIGFT